MASVVKLHVPPPALPMRALSPAERRVRVGSLWLKHLFSLLFAASAIVMAVGIAAMLFYDGDMLRMGPSGTYVGGGPADTVAFGSLPIDQRLIYVLVGLVRYAPVAMLFRSLRALFGGYAEGRVFTREAGRTLGQVGIWLCAYALTPLLCHLALSATGYEIDRQWLHLASVQAFVLGLLVFVIGQVMQVGHEISEDREGFV
ncbi:DUF2975 domain-containing protein [Sphingomonas crocodyli]|uniref:DUF2975 domain-containing protein n=1 Tax=Sphingomonas crocodyli TaxID=1979270 RepID=A0A437M8N5_9SPHN|nr:DUF2975 domain-containing protein [Sphingomonas crocodyli]RVT93895.1 DUF2975 domain-containing protein [Sphingomonas crocodyli]